MSRPTRLKISLQAVRNNVSVLRSLAPNSLFCAVIKADAYGQGAVRVGEAAIEAGADWLAVALIQEAKELREAGLTAPILVLSQPHPNELKELKNLEGVRPTVYTSEGIEEVASIAPKIPVHLKIETGMNRVGASEKNSVFLANQITNSGLILEGVFTHFASADEPESSFPVEQSVLFDQVIKELADNGHQPAIIHMANSAAAINFPASHRSMVRPGIAIYGAEPSVDLRDRCDQIGLKPTAQFETEVRHIHEIKSGETVSYGRRWTAPHDTLLATLPVGYGDGMPRSWWEEGCVIINGQRCPIRGVITMDQLMVEVGAKVAVGDKAILFGEQDGEVITAGEIAQATETISYEILASVGKRVPRIYEN